MSPLTSLSHKILNHKITNIHIIIVSVLVYMCLCVYVLVPGLGLFDTATMPKFLPSTSRME